MGGGVVRPGKCNPYCDGEHLLVIHDDVALNASADLINKIAAIHRMLGGLDAPMRPLGRSADRSLVALFIFIIEEMLGDAKIAGKIGADGAIFGRRHAAQVIELRGGAIPRYVLVG